MEKICFAGSDDIPLFEAQSGHRPSDPEAELRALFATVEREPVPTRFLALLAVARFRAATAECIG